jgi:hypothetical protein
MTLTPTPVGARFYALNLLAEVCRVPRPSPLARNKAMAY